MCHGSGVRSIEMNRINFSFAYKIYKFNLGERYGCDWKF